MGDPHPCDATEFLLSTKMIAAARPPPEPPPNCICDYDFKCLPLFLVCTNFATLGCDRVYSAFIFGMFLIRIKAWGDVQAWGDLFMSELKFVSFSFVSKHCFVGCTWIRVLKEWG